MHTQNYLYLSNKQLNTLSNHLLTSKTEQGGYIHASKNIITNYSKKGIPYHITTVDSIKKDTSNAEKDYIVIKNTEINYHSHPLSVYVENDCIVGQPSSEDLIQCIDYAVNGYNRCHIVVTLEGIYLIKICFVFIELFESLNKKIQEKIEKKIYNYFKQLHICRRKDVAIRINYTPEKYVKVINTFKLKKIPGMCKYKKLLNCNPFHIYFHPSNFYLKYKKNMKQIKKNILYNHDLHLVSNYDKNKPFFIDIS